ncbi:hypothetical protein AU255_12650 [Methyloprofundus sedimenti]|uniref:Peptidoglycan binding-like domain-containing protein n=1 Tax=Methyloprofundus sedimenti TaxID=1420851 RepID=A0A1V8MAJ7_9GAMM|nr:peptidoglycan-binding domain-containing protein [Methyloprofundus sedimenti]OQK18620.1 hypothetical protein AU255_12650 [Methyloprofundus sedimenti]
MNISKISTTLITLLSTTVFLAGCSDEQKETAKQNTPAISEYKPASALEKAVDTTTEIVDKSASVATNATEQAVEKTAAVNTDLMQMAKTETTNTAAINTAAVSNVTDGVKVTPNLVKKIQQALLNAGFNPGPVDGLIGSRTMNALKSFQNQKGLTAGEITKETLQALDIGN